MSKFDFRIIFFQYIKNKQAMTSVSYSNTTTFEEKDGLIQLCHHRDLGGKENGVYSKQVKWADVAINGVPLSKTFEYETEIENIIHSAHSAHSAIWPTTTIMINDRSYPYEIPVEGDDHSVLQGKKWVNRTKKITMHPPVPNRVKKIISNPPFQINSEKKEKHPVKPKREFEGERSIISSEQFHNISDKMSHGDLGKKTFEVSYGDNMMKKFVPPEHWITPEIKWDKIWSEIDTIETGHKRSFTYVKPGETNEDGIDGPAIYFYGPESPKSRL